MDAKELEKIQEKINRKIDRIFEKQVKKGIYDTNIVAPIKDGITDFECYCDKNNAPSIMWILKEPWDKIVDDEPYGGGFNIPEIQKEENFINNISRAQQRIIYSMQCIRTKGAETYDDMNWYYDMPNRLKEIAYINLSKIPGYKSSDASLIERAKIWKDVVKEQIDKFDPDIIITANTYDLLIELGIIEDLSPSLEKEDNLVDVYKRKTGKILINAYHPSYPGVGVRPYIESLAKAVSKYFNKN